MKAELHDGRILEFPDDTPPEIVDAAVKKELGTSSAPSPAPAPTDGTAPAPPTPTPSVPVSSGLAEEPSEGQDPSLLQRIAGEAPQVGGGMAAGVAAASAGMGLAPIVGMVALGGGAGEAYKQIGQHLSGSLDAPKTSVEALQRIGKAGLTEGGWELAGGLLIKGASKMLAPFKSTLMEGAEDVMRVFKGKIKPVLLPAEATESRVLDVISNIGESSIIGGNKIAAYKATRTKFFDDFAESLIGKFGEKTAAEDVGNLFVSVIGDKMKTFRAAERVMYNSVKAGRVKIPMSGAKNFVKPMLKRSVKLGGIEAKNSGDDLIEAVMSLPDNLSFKNAVELRSRLISRIDEMSVLNRKAPAIGKAKKLIGIVDRSIDKVLRGGNKEALAAWRTANQFHKGGEKQFNSTFIRRLVKMASESGTGAETIAPAIFKPGKITSVVKVKRVVDPPTWRKLQGFFVEHLMKKSTDVNGNMIGNRLLNNISGKPGSFGLPMMREILEPRQIELLQHFGKAMELAQKTQGEGAGRMLIQLTQAGAMGAVLTGRGSLPAATIILGPAVVSKMLLDLRIGKLLTRGLTLPAHSAEAAGILSRLSAASYRITHTKEEEE